MFRSELEYIIKRPNSVGRVLAMLSQGPGIDYIFRKCGLKLVHYFHQSKQVNANMVHSNYYQLGDGRLLSAYSATPITALVKDD